MQDVVDELPQYDDPDLDVGDLGIKAKRWYVEGDERFDDSGRFLDCVLKGIETRTPPLIGIAATMDALEAQTRVLAEAVDRRGWRLISIGWHPYCTGYIASPAYNAWELQFREAHTEYAAPDVYMLSYGPDLNLSPPWSQRRRRGRSGTQAHLLQSAAGSALVQLAVPVRPTGRHVLGADLPPHGTTRGRSRLRRSREPPADGVARRRLR